MWVSKQAWHLNDNPASPKTERELFSWQNAPLQYLWWSCSIVLVQTFRFTRYIFFISQRHASCTSFWNFTQCVAVARATVFLHFSLWLSSSRVVVGLHSNDFKRMSTFALQVKKLITSHISCGTPTNGSQCVLIFVYSVQVQSKFLSFWKVSACCVQIVFCKNTFFARSEFNAGDSIAMQDDDRS